MSPNWYVPCMLREDISEFIDMQFGRRQASLKVEYLANIRQGDVFDYNNSLKNVLKVLVLH